jgi:hypothetical protein
MGTTRVFVPQQALNAWLADGRVQLNAGRLTTQPEGLCYRVVEALRIVGEVTGGADPHELVGKVKLLAFVQELGADLLGDSMVLDDSAYEVVLGWVAVPDAPPALPPSASPDRLAPRHQSDAEALAQFLARNL